MKILFDHPSPFFLAHGGFQTQIEETKRALEQAGIEVQWVRWWDHEQRGDVIHYFGRPSPTYVEFAHSKGMKVVAAELLTGLGSRKPYARAAQRILIKILKRSSFFDRMNWRSFTLADAFIALTTWEAYLMRSVFGADPAKIHVIPNGVQEEFCAPIAGIRRGDQLVCTATITGRKRVLELARAAVAAEVPIRIVGRPYSESDSYFGEFLKLANAHPAIVEYAGAVSDRAIIASLYQKAKGFVLLSSMESQSLSTAEAAACRCPLLLTDLPWARSTFGDFASYCPVTSDTAVTARFLKQFYDKAPDHILPPIPPTWADLAPCFEAVYRTMLNSSR